MNSGSPSGPRVCADASEVAGADCVVTLDLHVPQIQGFFRIPVDDLYALLALCAEIVRQQLRDLVVVSPNTGFAKQAQVCPVPGYLHRHCG